MLLMKPSQIHSRKVKHLPLNAAKFSLQNIKVYDEKEIKIRWECLQDITSIFLCQFLQYSCQKENGAKA